MKLDVFCFSVYQQSPIEEEGNGGDAVEKQEQESTKEKPDVWSELLWTSVKTATEQNVLHHDYHNVEFDALASSVYLNDGFFRKSLEVHGVKIMDGMHIYYEPGEYTYMIRAVPFKITQARGNLKQFESPIVQFNFLILPLRI